MKIQILGTAQDGGVPHLNCSCYNCITFNRKVACIGIYTSVGGLLVDATPDIVSQWAEASKHAEIKGILLTHLHIGHYIGLVYLGREVANLNKFSIYCTASVADFIRKNKPFSYLIKREQIELRIIKPSIDIGFGQCKIIPFVVEHRNEDGNTIGILINDEVVYIPDMDFISDSTKKIIDTAELALLDATFYEKSGKFKQVPHPSMKSTMNMFENTTTKIIFTHLNHTNPAIDVHSIEYNDVIKNGFSIATDFLFIDV